MQNNIGNNSFHNYQSSSSIKEDDESSETTYDGLHSLIEAANSYLHNIPKGIPSSEPFPSMNIEHLAFLSGKGFDDLLSFDVTLSLEKWRATEGTSSDGGASSQLEDISIYQMDGIPETAAHHRVSQEEYVCSCGKAFRRQQELIRHFFDMLPEDLRPFHCRQCGYRFSRIHLVKKHQEKGCFGVMARSAKKTVDKERACQELVRYSKKLPRYLRDICRQVLNYNIPTSPTKTMDIRNLLN